VRAALVDVAETVGGTAYDALNEREVGIRMAAKTGSADLTATAQMSPDGVQRVRKHTWVSGWLPAERPLAVLVVFVQDTLQTSSHTAIWVARQFLRRPEVVRCIQELEEPR
jgi:cell division protein FtsI/penicillin-binding protein 2